MLISGARVIDIHTGDISLSDIVIEGETITRMGEAGSLSADTDMTVIDAAGRYVIPGLWDMHVHATVWPDSSDRMSSLFIANGVTSIRDMGANLDDILAFRRRAEQPGMVAPRLRIAGPIIDGDPRIMEMDLQASLPDISVAIDSPESAIALVDELVASGVDFVKTYELLQPEVFTALLKQAQQYDRPAAGHLPIRMAISDVVATGTFDIQHLGGMCSGIKYECVTDPQALLDMKRAILDGAAPDTKGRSLLKKINETVVVKPLDELPDRRAELIQLFVDHGTWHTPTLVNSIGCEELGFDQSEDWSNSFRFLPEARQSRMQAQRAEIKQITDPRKEWAQWNMETVAEMHKAGVLLLAGTDCPPTPAYTPGFALHYELKAMVQAGLSPLAALQTATINPARFFGISKEVGSVAVGQCADMVLLDADPRIDIDNTQRIAAVVSRGRFFDREALDDLLISRR